tara:strand:- start:550 stop:1080 length:531 start_codon:yes stop_codon:yes gene_type:complete
MVDSVKNYGIAGVSANVQLGKGGPKFIGSDSSQISIVDKNDAIEQIAIANGTVASHAVTKAQLDAIVDPKLQYIKTTVAHNSGTTAIGNADVNTFIHEVVVEKDAAWTNANTSTNITVGDSGDVDRLFAEFDPTVQTKSTPKHKYTSQTTVNAIVTQGAASAGNAVVTVFYSGTLE